MADNNYVLGRGKLYFDRFPDGTKTPTGERYFGNTPSFSMSQDSETLDHYNSDEGIKVKDASVILSQDQSFTFECDNISPANLALWFLGVEMTATQGAVTNVQENYTVKKDTYIQLGASANLPQGVRNVSGVTISGAQAAQATGTVTFSDTGDATDTVTINGHAITLVASGAAGPQINVGATATETAQNLRSYVNLHPAETGVTASGAAAVITLTSIEAGADGNSITLAKVGTDIAVSGATLTGGGAGTLLAANYEVDAALGRVYIKDTAAIAEDSVLTIEYDAAVTARNFVVAQAKSIYGALRFISANPTGKQKDYFFPYVQIAPDGDYELKGDEWQVMSFTGEILKRDENTERMYIDARG